jgi:DNA-binding response OmpR family regulator
VKNVAGKILVLEDDVYILELMKDILACDGHQVIGLGYPDLVLDVVGREKPDLIVIDIMLPKVSGVEVADRLWVNGFGSIPMIAMSASTIMLELARSTPFFCSVVRKPFDMVELLSEVELALAAFSPALPEHEQQRGVAGDLLSG